MNLSEQEVTGNDLWLKKLADVPFVTVISLGPNNNRKVAWTSVCSFQTTAHVSLKKRMIP